MSENNFSDLVYIISFVFSEKKELFDIKYHSFVRTIDGCFVTLNNDRKISLKRCLKINEFYAFEIGKCKKCDEVFIIGKIERNKLRQNSDIDIYENETNEQSPVDYFIFDENVEEFDNEYLEMHKFFRQYLAISYNQFLELHPNLLQKLMPNCHALQLVLFVLQNWEKALSLKANNSPEIL